MLLAVAKVKILREGGEGKEGEPEPGLIQPQLAQKPVLRGEVGVRALRRERGHRRARVCKSLG